MVYLTDHDEDTNYDAYNYGSGVFFIRHKWCALVVLELLVVVAIKLIIDERSF